MEFAWDEAKRLDNLRKHGIDFFGLESLFEGFTVTVLDDRFDYSEERYTTLGVLDGRVLVVAHTERGTAIRIISARKASKREQQSYFAAIAD